jgi:hypothetical protein
MGHQPFASAAAVALGTLRVEVLGAHVPGYGAVP